MVIMLILYACVMDRLMLVLQPGGFRACWRGANVD